MIKDNDNRHMRLNAKGQTILEYVIVLGIVIIILFTMTPLIRRGTQSMIKLVADQIGDQEAAEQQFDQSGHLKASYAMTRVSSNRNIQDRFDETAFFTEQSILTEGNTLLNLGFIARPQR